MNKRGRWLVGVAGLLMSAAIARTATAGCKISWDCNPSETCTEGECVSRRLAQAKAAEANGEQGPLRLLPTEYDYRDQGAMVAGAVLLPAAAIFGVMGGMWVAQDTPRTTSGDNPDQPASSIVGAPFLAGSGVMAVIGVSLLVYGAPMVPITAKDAAGSQVTIEPLLGPTSAGLRVTF